MTADPLFAIAMDAAVPPLPNSYWVIAGKIAGGEHPRGVNVEDTQQRLQRLLDAGVNTFIDLTMPAELTAYDPLLPAHVEYERKPIPDHSVPTQSEHMAETLGMIHDALQRGRCIYVHCRAGIGRTGTVLGCFLSDRGFPGEAALEQLNDRWQQCERSTVWRTVPETSAQVKYVLEWAALRALWQETGLYTVVPEQTDRFTGALLGLAVCDALAAGTQLRPPGSFVPVSGLQGGGPFELPMGAWGDDTSMALCLADSLLVSGGCDARDQVQRYLQWQQNGYLSSTGAAVGITPSVARALASAQWRKQFFAGSHDPKQLDREPLTRIAPVVMYYYADRDAAMHNAAESARTTCQAPLVLAACRLFAAMLHAALRGAPKSEVLAPDPALWSPANFKGSLVRLNDIAAGQLRPRSVGDIVSDGDALQALEAAVWVFRASATFRDGALMAANLGRDSDIIGALYGQLAGSHYGAIGVPPAWRSALLRAAMIEDFAARLSAHASTAVA